jgi:hypothetical protein
MLGGVSSTRAAVVVVDDDDDVFVDSITAAAAPSPLPPCQVLGWVRPSSAAIAASAASTT